jgi:hypothetical protein
MFKHLVGIIHVLVLPEQQNESVVFVLACVFTYLLFLTEACLIHLEAILKIVGVALIGQ